MAELPRRPDLSLRAALNRIELFAPLSDLDMARLVRAIHAELDVIAGHRGDVVDFARQGAIGPRPPIEIVYED
jgi:hypothetical protein